ncbi:MAG: RDD family protein [Candidatus Kariarchaeaceae archaeon]|jgi:uncharacterized RDD family membrane protein YckC
MIDVNIELDLYLGEINRFLPYGKQKNEELIVTIREDLLERNIIDDFHSTYGDPREVAMNIASMHQDKVIDADWIRRTLAFIIDMSLMAFLGFLVLYLPFIETWKDLEKEDLDMSGTSYILFFIYIAILSAIIISYFFWSEKIYATTIGKQIFGMRVVDSFGLKIGWKQTLVRNFTKIQGEFLPFDVLLGWLMEDELRTFRRATEIASNTRVIILKE